MARYDADALTEEVLAKLNGETTVQEQFTWLSNPVSDTETTLPVEAPGQLSRGVAEVGTELVLVASTGDSTVTLAPFGRGWQGTLPQSWPVNTRITFGPRFPRYRILNTINDVIRTVYPMLFAVDTFTFTASSTVITTYELPADCEDVLTVKQQVLGGSKDWLPLHNWRFDRDANTDEFPNGRTIDIWDWIIPGREIQVTYVKRPQEMLNDWSETGLNETAWPAVMFGVLYHLIAPKEAGMTAINAVKAAEAQRRRGHSASDLSLQYFRLHQQLLTEERDRLLADHEFQPNMELF